MTNDKLCNSLLLQYSNTPALHYSRVKIILLGKDYNRYNEDDDKQDGQCDFQYAPRPLALDFAGLAVD